MPTIITSAFSFSKSRSVPNTRWYLTWFFVIIIYFTQHSFCLTWISSPISSCVNRLNAVEMCYLILGLGDGGMNKHESAGAGSGKWGWWGDESASGREPECEHVCKCGGNAMQMRTPHHHPHPFTTTTTPLYCTGPGGAALNQLGRFEVMVVEKQCCQKLCLRCWPLTEIFLKHIRSHKYDLCHPSFQQGWNALGILQMSLAVRRGRITAVLACHYVHQTNPPLLPALNSNSYC